MARASNYWNFKSTALKFYKSIASKVLKTGVRKLKEKSGNYHDASINFHVFNQGTQINWSFKLIVKKPVKNIFWSFFNLTLEKNLIWRHSRLGFPFAKLLRNLCGTKRKIFLSLHISFARKKTTICAIIRKSHFAQNCPFPFLRNSSFAQFCN